MIIIDNRPWTDVEKIGFSRFISQAAPKLRIHTEKYYRGQLDEVYEKVLEAVRQYVSKHNPSFFCLGFDGWSQFHNGFIGYVAHYLADWKREKVVIDMIPSNDSHSGKELLRITKVVTDDWNITNKTKVIQRDNAANMIKMFKEDDCPFSDAFCLIHTLQIVINHTVLAKASVESLMETCRKLCTHANHSTVFSQKLKEAQVTHMNKVENECLSLIQDVATRWNSTFSMAVRILKLRPALEHLLIDYPVTDVDFSNRDWELLGQVVTVLKVFWDITLELSKGGACISISIPCVSIILNQLQVDRRNDRGIIGWKSTIRDEMIRMFGPRQEDDHLRVGGLDIETKDIYRLATILDPQFKVRFFRDKCIMEKLVLRLLLRKQWR